MEEYNDYEIPFDDMSEEDFLYRAMNVDDPMYMGPTNCFRGREPKPSPGSEPIAKNGFRGC